MSDEFLMWVCQDGTSNKWWTYEVSGDSVTTRWGRLGQKGQLNTRLLGSSQGLPSYKRDDFIRKKIYEKERKGYNLISRENFDLLLQPGLLKVC